MTPLAGFPTGFEDGQILRYSVEDEVADIVYEYWNESQSLIRFTGFVGLVDIAAIGVIIGAANEEASSELKSDIASRIYEIVPEDLDWKSFQFLDLDDKVALEVIARHCEHVSLSG